MRTFTFIWFGQLSSTIGSYMSEFALSIWVWQVTGSVTTLALINFCFLAAQVPMTLLAGIMVDRLPRKPLMILGDMVAAISTLSLLLLQMTDQLDIWHLYACSVLNGGFSEIQRLAYAASVSLLVPPQHYTRATSMETMIHYGASIFAPALAGMFYPVLGLEGIFLIDLATFSLAIAPLLFIHIPQTPPSSEHHSLFSELTFGFRFICCHQGLANLLCLSLLFWFVHDLGNSLYTPMVLAQSGGNSEILGTVLAAAGLGGLCGATMLTMFGGFRQRLHGMLWGFVGAGLAKTVFGWGTSVMIWCPAQFCSSVNFPLLISSERSIWLETVPQQLQGRVLATHSLMFQIVSAIATLLAGWLADDFFEPMMMPEGSLAPIFGYWLGIGTGAGLTLFYILTSLTLVAIGLGGYCLRSKFLFSSSYLLRKT